MATQPNSLQAASDSNFQALPASDQIQILSTLDPKFAALPESDKPQVITAMQKHAIGRPDLVAPPAVAKPAVDMQIAGLGTDTSTVPNPKTAIAMSEKNAPPEVGEAITGAAALGVVGMAAGGWVVML